MEQSNVGTPTMLVNPEPHFRSSSHCLAPCGSPHQLGTGFSQQDLLLRCIPRGSWRSLRGECGPLQGPWALRTWRFSASAA